MVWSLLQSSMSSFPPVKKSTYCIYLLYKSIHLLSNGLESLAEFHELLLPLAPVPLGELEGLLPLLVLGILLMYMQLIQSFPLYYMNLSFELSKK
jgi:hypothetical protein